MLSSLYEDLNNGNPPTAAVTTRYTKYLNDAIQAMVSEPGMVRIMDSDIPYQFPSVAAQARYTVPSAVSEIRHITERTNDRALAVITLGQYRRLNPDPTSSSGTPTHYVPIGQSAVAVQPSDGAIHTIWISSTSAADVGTAYLEGTLLGTTVTTSVVMTGVTPIAFPSGMEQITDLYLSTPVAGNVTVRLDTAVGTSLAVLWLGTTRTRYLAFYLYPTPDAAVTYFVDYRRMLTPLVNATDEPPGPVECHPYYTAYARAREYEKTNDDRYQTALEQAERWRSRFKYSVLEHPDSLPVAREGGVLTGHSRLGGWYPADHYHRG